MSAHFPLSIIKALAKKFSDIISLFKIVIRFYAGNEHQNCLSSVVAESAWLCDSQVRTRIGTEGGLISEISVVKTLNGSTIRIFPFKGKYSKSESESAKKVHTPNSDFKNVTSLDGVSSRDPGFVK